MTRATKDKIIEWGITLIALTSVISFLGIAVVLFAQGLPAFNFVGLWDFLTGRGWHPTHVYEPEFGILPLIMGTLWVAAGALIITVPFGVGAAIYISEVARPAVKDVIKPIIELLNSVPSVVMGFIGLLILAPAVMNLFNLPVGLTIFTASVMLALLYMPYVVSIAEDALNAIPMSLREASYAVGANKMETITKVVLPAAFPGVSTAVILGGGQMIGETMIVLMVAGGAAMVPTSFFEPARPMTATIAAEMGETVVGGDHYHALFAIGIVLFVITLILFILVNLIEKKFRREKLW
ncbi:MAG: phosphate ABC transporter permease subunit PstC [Desulfobulbaceae bacterium]|nr:MAG: phosphate ABC transporter permease subunit PstC [Desulfobulbaceae bacterium]